MDWTQFATLMISMIGIFLWSRSESRSDIREVRQIQAEDRKEILNLIRGIQEEIKDFHGRLCAIEERRVK